VQLGGKSEIRFLTESSNHLDGPKENPIAANKRDGKHGAPERPHAFTREKLSSAVFWASSFCG